jgi:hypothetical protein
MFPWSIVNGHSLNDKKYPKPEGADEYDLHKEENQINEEKITLHPAMPAIRGWQEPGALPVSG